MAASSKPTEYTSPKRRRRSSITNGSSSEFCTKKSSRRPAGNKFSRRSKDQFQGEDGGPLTALIRSRYDRYAIAGGWGALRITALKCCVFLHWRMGYSSPVTRNLTYFFEICNKLQKFVLKTLRGLPSGLSDAPERHDIGTFRNEKCRIKRVRMSNSRRQ